MSSLKGLNKKDSNSSDYVNEKISKLFYKKEYSTWQIKPWQIKPIHNYKWWDIFIKNMNDKNINNHLKYCINYTWQTKNVNY